MAAEPAAATVADTATPATAATPDGGSSAWPWLLAALAAVAAVALGALALRRRRRDEAVWEEDYIEEQPVAAVGSAPAMAPAADGPRTAIAEHADLVAPEAAEVAAITEASAPVAGRPWIELSLRSLRAGASDDAALVDLELTLANAGDLPARDVRVSTFMLGDASIAPTDMERLLATGHAGAEVEAGSIEAGEGSRIDARLAVPRDAVAADTFQPVVIADVRYTLPDGAEGRTAAAFAVGAMDAADHPAALRLDEDIREDVAATLHGQPERV